MFKSSFLRIVFLLVLTLCATPVHADPTATGSAGAGSIIGRVTDLLTGLPIEGATVEVVNVSIETTTDADGRYRLANVPVGPRYLRFDSDRYAYEYYIDAPRLFLAQPVEVRAGEETAGIDATLAPGGSITGRVTDLATGAALAGVRVQAQLPDVRPWWPWRTVREGVTDEDGRYAVEGLWTAVYQVQFVDEAGDHATQGYGENVGVLMGEEVTDIDIALPHEGHIAGQVTDLQSGAPLAGVTVRVLGPDDDEDLAATVETDADGRWEATSLAAGGYWLHFEPHDKLHAARYYGGETEIAWESQSVTVEVGRTTGGVDQQLPELAAITGRVTDALTGAGLRGVGVYLDWYSEYRGPDVTTGPDGGYVLSSVTPGKHTVWLHDASGKYRDGQARQLDETETVTVQEGRVSREVNAALEPFTVTPPGVRKITGTVTDVVTGQPLASIQARLWWCYQYGHRRVCDDLSITTTDAQGHYEFDNPAWQAASLTFSDPSGAYLTQDAANFRTPGLDEVLVFDMALQRYDRVYGGIAGKVTDAASGEPLAGQQVCADNAETDDYSCTHTAADGVYTLSGLKIGPYKVGFGLQNRLGDRYWRWYYGGDEAGTDVTVTVKANEITAKIDATLPENGRVAGTVYRSDTGAPLANAGVAICKDQDCIYVGTGTDGSYARYAQPGAYRVTAYGNGYERRYYRDTPNMALAEPVTVTLGRARRCRGSRSRSSGRTAAGTPSQPGLRAGMKAWTCPAAHTVCAARTRKASMQRGRHPSR